MTQITLTGKKLTKLDELYAKRKMLYDDMNRLIKLRNVHIKTTINQFKVNVREIDRQIEKLERSDKHE